MGGEAGVRNVYLGMYVAPGLFRFASCCVGRPLPVWGRCLLLLLLLLQ